jgi:methyl-accepting chemotaxis protein
LVGETLKLIFEAIAAIVAIGGGFVAYGRLSANQEDLNGRLTGAVESLNSATQELVRAVGRMDKSIELNAKTAEYMHETNRNAVHNLEIQVDELKGEFRRLSSEIHKMQLVMASMQAKPAHPPGVA